MAAPVVEASIGGLTAEEVTAGKALTAEGNATLRIQESTWVALRVRGSYRGKADEIAAHTSAVQILVDDHRFTIGDYLVTCQPLRAWWPLRRGRLPPSARSAW